MNIEKAHELKQRPSLLEVESELRNVKKVSWALSIILSIIFLAIIPLISLNFGDFSLDTFKFWIIIAQIFVFGSLLYSIFAPFSENYILKFLINRTKKIIPKKVSKNRN